MRQAVGETVKCRREAGIDIVSDGEPAKISYATYVKDRYSGFSGPKPRSSLTARVIRRLNHCTNTL